MHAIRRQLSLMQSGVCIIYILWCIRKEYEEPGRNQWSQLASLFLWAMLLHVRAWEHISCVYVLFSRSQCVLFCSPALLLHWSVQNLMPKCWDSYLFACLDGRLRNHSVTVAFFTDSFLAHLVIVSNGNGAKTTITKNNKKHKFYH